MTDIPLIVQADTSSVAKGKGDLEGFKKALGGVGEATDKVTGSSERGKAASRGYTDQQRQATTESKKASQAAMEQATAVDRVSQAYRVGKAAIAGFIGMAIVRDLQNTTMSLQKIDMTFQAVTGSAAAANVEMDYVRTTADRLGQDVLTAAGAYAKLLAATKGTNISLEDSRNVFEGITAAATAYGLSQYELEGALMAVQQMISKGSVQAEELRGQLGERLPGAFQIAARSMGMSTQQLSKALEQGEVSAEEFVKKFGAQLQSEFAGFASTAQTAGRAVNELENSMLMLKEAVIDGGFRNGFFMVLDALNGLAQSDGAQAAARALGAAFDVLAEAVGYLLDLLEKLANSAIVTGFFNLMADHAEVAIVAITGLYMAMRLGLMGAITGVIASGGGIAGVFAMMATSIASAAGAVAGFLVALGPVGWAIIAVGALAAAFALLGDSTKSLGDAQDDVQKSFQRTVEAQTKLDELNAKLVTGYAAIGTAAAQGSDAQVAAGYVNIANLQEQIRNQELLLASKRQLLQADQDELGRSIDAARAGMGDAAKDALPRANRGSVAQIQQLSDEEAIALAEKQIALALSKNEALSATQQLYLENNAALQEAIATHDGMTTTLQQMETAATDAAEALEKAVREAKAVGDAKASIAAVAGGFDAMTRAINMTQADAQALDTALEAAFAAETPQAMADAIRTVQASLKASGQEGGQLSTALDAALRVLGAMEGVNIAGPIAAGAAAAAGLATNLAAAAANYSALRDRTGQGGPDAARSAVQFGQVSLDGQVITPGVFGAGLASPSAGSGGGSGGGGGASAETFRKDQAETLKAASEAQNLLNEAMRGGSEAMEEYSKAQERAEQMAQLLKAAREEGITLSAKEVEALEDALLAQDRLTEKADEIKQAYDAIKDAAGEFGSATGKALADSLFGIGNFNDALKASFKDLVGTILAELGKLAANKLLLMLLGSDAGGAGGGGGLFGGGGGGLKIPGFAGGGTHSGGLRIVGENGPEIEATGASRIHSTSDLRGMMKPTTNVIINNNAPNVQVETAEREDGSVEVLISATQRATADGVLRGTGDLSKALETTYGLTRRGR